MTMRFLSMRDISDQYDIPLGTLKSWLKRGTNFPPADVEVGTGGGQRSALGWSRETVDRWKAEK